MSDNPLSPPPPSDPPPPQPPSGSSGASGGGFDDDARGLFAALFDFRFNTFVTPKLVTIVYMAFTVLIAIGFLGFLVSAFAQSAVFGIIVLLVGPIVALVYLAFFRMALEMYYAIVRLSEDVHHGRGRV